MAWHYKVRNRLRSHWRLKAVGIPGFIAIFFIGYFLLLKFPAFPVTIMPMTMIDRLIPFSPSALPLYVSLWLYTQVAPGLIDDRRELISFGVAAGTLSFVGFACFFFWPTSTPTVRVDFAHHTAFGSLKTIDAAGNACPSLHVAFAIFSAIWIDRLLRQLGGAALVRSLNWVWCIGIVYSTLATKQHVFLDVLAGVALGWGGAAIHLPAIPRSVTDPQLGKGEFRGNVLNTRPPGSRTDDYGRRLTSWRALFGIPRRR